MLERRPLDRLRRAGDSDRGDTAPLPGVTGRPAVLTLRDLDDALAFRAVISAPGARLVIAGAGFIGLEVAATARGLGADVTVVEPLQVPLERALGPLVGTVCESPP